MSIFTEGTFNDPITQDDLEPTAGARRRATVADAWASMVGPSLYRWGELDEARKWGGMAFGEMSPDQARSWIDGQGLTGHLTVEDRAYNPLELSILARRKKAELERRSVLERAGGGFARGGERLLLSLGTSLADPLTVATAFVPVVNEATYGRLLAQAGRSALARAGVRAGVGAAEGTVGQALVEPIVYGAHQAEQADYTLYDSLANIAFGGVFGGGLHSVGGAVVDWRTGRRAPLPETRSIETQFAEQLKADPDGARVRYALLPDTDGGRVMSVDTARELSPDYLADRTRSAEVHEPASAFIKDLYAKKLQEAPAAGQDPVVLFSAGGTGAGKTTGLDALGPMARRAQIIYDTNMNSVASAAAKIDQALQAGKRVHVAYTFRDPVDALRNGALPRAMRQASQFGTGRTVPLSEHAATHAGSRKTIPAIMEMYKGDDRVSFSVIDNSRGKGNARAVASLEELPARDYNSLREDLRAALEEEYAAGRISEAVYRGFRGPEEVPGIQPGDRSGAGGQPEPQSAGARPGQVSAATRADAAAPQTRENALRAVVAQDLAGEPVNVEPLFELDPATRTRPISETLDQLRRPAAEPQPEPVPIVDATERTAVEQQIADLDEMLKDLEAELKLDDTDLPADLRADLEAVKEAEAEARDLAETARMLAACAMRKSA